VQISEFTIRLIILLLPGGLATLLVELFTVHRKWSSFRFILYSIFLGAASYVTYQLYLYVQAVTLYLIPSLVNYFGVYSFKPAYQPKILTVWASLLDGSKGFESREIAFSCLFAILVGGAISTIIQKKVLFKLARVFSISTKFGDESLYEYLLNTTEVEWVWIRSKTRGLTYRGAVAAFTATEKVREIVLKDVTVYIYETSERCYDVSILYLNIGPTDVIEVPNVAKKKEEEDDREKNLYN
jgi:hypothetical protein